MTLQHRERITVARQIDGGVETPNETFEENYQRYEQIDVWNLLTVNHVHKVQPSDQSHVTLHQDSRISVAGGGSPEYVTEWAAKELREEHAIDLPTDDFDIEVVDIDSEDIHIV